MQNIDTNFATMESKIDSVKTHLLTEISESTSENRNRVHNHNISLYIHMVCAYVRSLYLFGTITDQRQRTNQTPPYNPARLLPTSLKDLIVSFAMRVTKNHVMQSATLGESSVSISKCSGSNASTTELLEAEDVARPGKQQGRPVSHKLRKEGTWKHRSST
jgi:hypothetical protein